jgi:tripartite ATP-independent transporter DctM subunit
MVYVALVFFGLLILGMPVGIVLGVAGLVGLIDMGGGQFLQMVPARFFSGLDLFPFLAMPFFILAGEIMNRTGLTLSLVRLAESLVGWLRGGMAHSNMLASVLFAGLTGSATADAAAFGNTMVPAMKKAGYTGPFACAVTAAGSIIGPIIPPSTLAVIYGAIMGVSIAGLFAAGIVPGLLLCAAGMAVIALLGKRLNLPKAQGRPQLRVIVREFRSSLVALILPLFILVSILGGWATPTEASALAVFYALAVGGVYYRNIGWQDLYEMLARTALITGVIFLIIASATVLGWWMTFNQIPQMIATAFLTVSENPAVIIAMLLTLLLLVGLFMDINAALIILAPVLAPLTLAIGLDPVHAGIIIILALSISLMTPPVGACLFVIASVTGERVEAITKALWPFILAEVAILILVAYWEPVAMTVPRLLGF